MSAHQTEDNNTAPDLKQEDKFPPELALHERLPTEILVIVFLMAAGNRAVVFPPDFSSIPWVLTQVCRRWRNVAFQESRLWNRIHFRHIDGHKAPRLIALANHILPPTRLLSIITDNTYNLWDEIIMDPFVIPRLPRLRAFRSFLGSDAYSIFFAASPESFVSIEELDISWAYLDNRAIDLAEHTTIFSKAHKLCNLRIIGSYPVSPPRVVVRNLLGVSIPWHQLVCLDFRPGALDPEQMYFILRQSPVLQIFTAHIDGSLEEDTAVDIVVPHLRTLSLMFFRGYSLRHLILPALRNLRLDGPLMGSTDSDTSYMLSRSQCTLHVFERAGSPQSDTLTANELLSNMSAVRTFIARGIWLDQPTLEMIGLGELLPCVNHFSCGARNLNDFLDALETRLAKVKEIGSTVTPIQVAVGVHPDTMHDVSSDAGVGEALPRLRVLNEQHGTQYSILPSRYEPNIRRRPVNHPEFHHATHSLFHS